MAAATGRIEGIGHRITGDRSGQSNARGKGWEYLHLAVDDHSRLAYSEIFPDERRKSCLTFLFNALRFFRSHGVRVYRVMPPSRQIAAQSPVRQWIMASASAPNSMPRN